MNEKDRQTLYELFQKYGKAAIDIFSKKYHYSRLFVEKELNEMIDDIYDLGA